MNKEIIRGCGTRVDGELCVMSASSLYGKPIEDFLIDPPVKFTGGPFRGVIFERDTASFWVGEDSYPYCPDFIEETRLYGSSRRIAINKSHIEKFARVKKLLYIHPLAYQREQEILKIDFCPKGKEKHLQGAEPCIRNLYYFIDGKGVLEGKRVFTESTSYSVPGPTVPSPKLLPGYSLWLPFSHLEYVDRTGKTRDPIVNEEIKNGIIKVVDH